MDQVVFEIAKLLTGDWNIPIFRESPFASMDDAGAMSLKE
jgi:hypothetical protein